ncbi:MULTISPECIES: disulfide bond formation protein B [Rhizobium]|uniref:Disulfide bond formation protein B n=1 Tax=Rhizobium rhododendri TaxID=2506430 RepID=A0ABY8IF49_9HYPH|nr:MULTISPECIES: disulfide bond formation protein B [Rhizobium]MBZ5760945.1 disulfide bond formation protein B [Rhizobium sp. VS19-DR96]MBZ5765271.1 disulfide bond formation protein B [Rhizobium sp. VS19-DR129.2]MBZ5774766.1 disulfide bond formation protein B [Rhizobium sp. VS19-DRK62.2]MBZ5784780.1 disulfide bond formation protein B [Rhizobium sp. VS19-DR121]MBZ5801392.1 disulfide bond formation protein B [Rhizobium sp. VS19-DR181]
MTETINPARPAFGYAALLALGMSATVGSALGFQYIGGYTPCELCLMQRLPYYYGIPVAILAALSALFGMPAWLTRALLAVAGIMMLVGGGMGVYHAGVEWNFWEGPSSCTGPAFSSTTPASGGVLGSLNKVHGPSCSVAALRVLGLSMAGWNVIASLILAAIAVAGFRKAA